MTIIPPYLKKGDTIGLVCPAGFMPVDKLQTCMSVLMEWGYKVKAGNTIGSQDHYFSGTDDQRLDDLQQMLDDDFVHAILCGRGGYGVGRIIDRLNFKKFKKSQSGLLATAILLFCIHTCSTALKLHPSTHRWLLLLITMNTKMNTCNR